ncbi:hypothetical protein [Terricaulis sp.]|uniref:hypothetical protein n=1 Tax=Terricaulis sp. TaxID=2768686 RepID=UPI002AC56520|nr:hypothetical protein [Terricaulis sp.]MDZ4689709.1 hypothetical protein [Terricaulis sp.]
MSSTTPVVLKNNRLVPLQRVSLAGPSKDASSQFSYDEAWLQDLIQHNPSILPIAEIEPGFGDLIPVAKEVSCGSQGFIDNLFVTGDGGIAFVETKLWRNPEARRAVVAQTLDYASALAKMSYADFEAAALSGVLAVPRPRSLYELVSGNADALDETSFIDALSTNLRRGRMIAIAAGDGIRSETETIAEHLQSHAGVRFTFALVAIELYRDPDGLILAVPRNIAKTTLIERGVVEIRDGRIDVSPPVQSSQAAITPKRGVSMTEELFMEEIAKRDPQLPAAIRSFLEKAALIGVEQDWRATLNLKWRGLSDGPDINLGFINKNGSLSTEVTNSQIDPAATREYQETLARLSGGTVVESKYYQAGPLLVAADKKSLVKIEALLPQHADAWLKAMEVFIGRLRDAQNA